LADEESVVAIDRDRRWADLDRKRHVGDPTPADRAASGGSAPTSAVVSPPPGGRARTALAAPVEPAFEPVRERQAVPRRHERRVRRRDRQDRDERDGADE